MHPARWNHAGTATVTNLLFQGFRRWGRPKRKWRDNLDTLHEDWPELVTYRDVWQSKADTQQWVETQQWHKQAGLKKSVIFYYDVSDKQGLFVGSFYTNIVDVNDASEAGKIKYFL